MPSDEKEEKSISLQQKSIRGILPKHTSPAAKQKHVRAGKVFQVWCELGFKLPPSSEVLESSIWVQPIATLWADQVKVAAKGKNPSCLILENWKSEFQIFL